MLTKSNLLDLRQCPRKLWLSINQPKLADERDPSLARRAVEGKIVEQQARANVKDAIGVSDVRWLSSTDDKVVDAEIATAELASSAKTAFFEVPLHANGLYARADILRPAKGGGYVLLETKASTFPYKRGKNEPDKVEPHHLEDLAIQIWVAQQSGIVLADAALNYLDNRWTYPGDGDYEGLFKEYPVLEQLADTVQQVPIWLSQAKGVLSSEAMPKCGTGAQCKKPRQCGFFQYCRAMEPVEVEHPLELLPDMAGKTLAKKLKAERGYVSLLEPHPSEFKGAAAELFCRMQKAHKTGSPVLEPGAKDILEALPYPRYFFDFEGIDLAVPRWKGVRPYEQIPFQWSCHIETAPGVFEHVDFLDVSGEDPSLNCIKALQAHIKQDGGPILVYYQTYEKSRFKELANRHPEHAVLMNEFISRLVDLHPLVKDNYYHPAMRGSFSIKKVLPTIAPELSYDDLGDVQDGTAAQLAYLKVCFDVMVDSERAELKEDMREYCGRDTWAMVVLAYFLESKKLPGHFSKEIETNGLSLNEAQPEEPEIFSDVPF